MGRQQAARARKKKRKPTPSPAPAAKRDPWGQRDGDLFGDHQPIESSKDSLTISTTRGRPRTGSVTITARRTCRLRLRVRGDDFAIVSPAPATGIKLEAGDEYVATILFSPRALGSAQGTLELTSTAAAGPTLTLDSKSRVALKGTVAQTRKKRARKPERKSPRLIERDEETEQVPLEQRDGYSPKESPRIPAFSYKVLSSRARTPAGIVKPLTSVVYIRDRVLLRIEPTGSSGPLELDDASARGFAIVDQSESPDGAIWLTLRAEVKGSYKLRFHRGCSHYKGEPIDLVILPEALRPRSSVLGPLGPVDRTGDQTTSAPDEVSRLRCRESTSAGDSACFLESDVRGDLKRIVSDFVVLAALRFSDASAVVEKEISSKLSVERAFWRAVFELVFGFGVGRIAGLVGAGLSKIPDDLPAAAREHAAQALGRSDLIRGPLRVATKHAVRLGVNAYTPGPKALFAAMRAQSQRAAQKVITKVGSYTDAELIAAIGLWDARNATEADYVAAIRAIVGRWENQVDRIGERTTAPNRSLGKARVVWIEDGRVRRLALAIHVKADHVRGADIERDEYGNSRVTEQGEVIRRRPESRGHRQGSLRPADRWYFETWIDPDMQEMAIARAGGSLKTVRPGSADKSSDRPQLPVLNANMFTNREAFDVD